MKRLFLSLLVLQTVALFGMAQGPVVTPESTVGTEIKAIEDILINMCSVGEKNIGSTLHTTLKARAIRLVNETKDSTRDPFVLALAALFSESEQKIKYAQMVVELMKSASETSEVPQANPRSRADTMTLHRRAKSDAAVSRMKRSLSLLYKSGLTDQEEKQQLIAEIRNEVIREVIETYKKHKDETR